MNFQSLVFFKKLQQNPVPTYTGTGSCEVQKTPILENVLEPGSYLYRNRFLSWKSQFLRKFTLGTRFLPTGNRFLRPEKSKTAIWQHLFIPNPIQFIPIRIQLTELPKQVIVHDSNEITTHHNIIQFPHNLKLNQNIISWDWGLNFINPKLGFLTCLINSIDPKIYKAY